MTLFFITIYRMMILVRYLSLLRIEVCVDVLQWMCQILDMHPEEKSLILI